VSETYERYAIGDEVWCLAWIGMPFVVTGKNDDTRTIEIDGTGPCSLPEGALLDLDPQNHFMLTHEKWDSIWYWPDMAGERYREVVERFVAKHQEGEIVCGYAAGSVTVADSPASAMSFRLSLAGYEPYGQIRAEPVVAVASDGTLVRMSEPSISSDQWHACGPALALELRMVGYRWALTYGKLVLNWEDFD
jgi:hypothetical protein